MPVVTRFHADAPPLVMSHWHPIGWTEALAQCRHSRAMARIDGVSGTCGDELLDHVPAKSEDGGEAGSVRTANQELRGRLWPHRRGLVGASGLRRTRKRRGWMIVFSLSASARDLAATWSVLDVGDVIDAATRAEGLDTGKPGPDRRHVALKKADVAPVQALVAGDSLTKRAGCGPGRGAASFGAVPRTRPAGFARGRRLEGHAGVAGLRTCFNGRAYRGPCPLSARIRLAALQ
ncbi:hypothetical protein OG564_43405 [Streptomyces sp. NBC_01280]|uniref:hypothetical protein n=1 Tax=unclassified Streptomyces TaxID=2593676 RepID=UPI002E2FB98D|nr:hypothetical protein [Streptomyces sp. NBC_01280]WSE12314.1 hypothetical protein OG518_02735 [Streptomyces sp. NBC_01397]WSE19315.1 hypothetical protein OG518_41715 [Streptomyces sp. NBC_01397]